ncbi:MAG TPA: hypothetical protein VLF61_01070 [Rhabdochlamydiaceae bacterium]|nr:hypothetical protein [Rhabdochlamydiaceae bacterium]
MTTSINQQLVMFTGGLKNAATQIAALVSSEYDFLKNKIFVPTKEAFKSQLAGKITATLASFPVVLGLTLFTTLFVLLIGPFLCLTAQEMGASESIPYVQMKELEGEIIRPSEPFNPMNFLRENWDFDEVRRIYLSYPI